VYKRQIYHIAESNRKNRFGSENRIESKLFLPELECFSPYVGNPCWLSWSRLLYNITYRFILQQNAVTTRKVVHSKTVMFSTCSRHYRTRMRRQPIYETHVTCNPWLRPKHMGQHDVRPNTTTRHMSAAVSVGLCVSA